MSTYVVLLPGDESAWEAATTEERQTAYGKHAAFAEALAARGHKVSGGAELAHSRDTTLVRRAGDDLAVTQGPYAETVEQLTGFYVIESDDLDDLVQCVGILAEAGDGIEIRLAVGGTET